MSATKIVISILKVDAGVVAFAEDRVGDAPMPKNWSPPAVICYLVSETDGLTLGGANEYPESRVTVECYAEKPGIADRLGKAVILALRNYRGAIAGCVVDGIFKDGTDQADNDAPSSVMRRLIDFRVRWREA